jgi:hypothetical protein
LPIHVPSITELSRTQNTSLWRGKIQGTEILRLEDFEAWSLALREEHKLQVSGNKEKYLDPRRMKWTI